MDPAREPGTGFANRMEKGLSPVHTASQPEADTLRLTSLQQRLFLAILLPVGVFLMASGFLGFFYARTIMLRQWQETALLRLQRAAHFIDMRLAEPIQLIELLAETGGDVPTAFVQDWLLEELERFEGVTDVALEWEGPEPGEPGWEHRMGMGMGRMRDMGRDMAPMMRFHRIRIDGITSPVYDAQAGEETVSLITLLKDASGKTMGRLVVDMRFDYIMEDLRGLSWWQSDNICLVDRAGRLLAGTIGPIRSGVSSCDSDDPLAGALKARLEKETQGTLLGGGHPPENVAGFYKIENAPWFLVIFARGERVLAPIIRFRLYAAIAGGLAIAVILILIRYTVGRITDSVREISQEAERVAKGNYGGRLPVRTADEVGQLTTSFNTMVDGLRERDFIRNTFGRYVDDEVAREILARPEAARLGGDKREVAVLMSDIRGFTPLAESLNPEDTVTILNIYFGHMIRVIKRNHGIIVDFFGDGVLVFFDPLDRPVETAIASALGCAEDMRGEMDVVNRELGGRDLPHLETGIGINAGPVVVGNIGSETRAKYGIVGSAVNVTHRIQSEAGPGEVVLTDAVLARTSQPVRVKRSFRVRLKGLEGEMTIHVLEDREQRREGQA